MCYDHISFDNHLLVTLFPIFPLCTFIMSPKYFNLYLRDSSKSSKSSFVWAPFLLLLLLNTDIILLWLDEQLSSWDFPSLLCWFGFTILWLSFLPLSLFKPSRNFWVWGGDALAAMLWALLLFHLHTSLVVWLDLEFPQATDHHPITLGHAGLQRRSLRPASLFFFYDDLLGVFCLFFCLSRHLEPTFLSYLLRQIHRKCF